MENFFEPSLNRETLQTMSSLALAHVGDAVYDLLTRTRLSQQGRSTAKNLHRETVKRVSAPAQSEAMIRIEPFLSEQEHDIFRRGRNAHLHFIPKNATRAEYARATGLECLFGYLWLSGQANRILQLYDIIIEGEETYAP